MRLFLGVLLSVLLLGLVSCPPAEEADGTKPVVKDNGKPVTADTSPIKLGFNLEETGNAATFGVSAHKGAELAIDELNAGGGVLGRSIEAVFDDNASLPQQSANVASKLINQNRVDVLIGAVGSSQSIAMARIAEESKVPMVTPASTNPDVTRNDDGSVRTYVFRTCFTDDFQGEGIADFAVNGPIGAKRACIFYDAENDYSVGIYETVLKVAADKGLEVVAEDSYLGQSETDFRTKLNKFKRHEFDVLIVPGYYNQVALIANQAREVGLEQPLLGGDGFDSPELWKVAGPNIEGSYFTNHYASDDMDPAVQGFIKKYKDRYGGQMPDAMSILTYDAVMVVADAIRRVGGTDKDALAATLADTAGFKGAAGTITIDEFHNATKKLVVLAIGEGGAFSWVYTYDPFAAEETEAPEEMENGGELAPDEAAGDDTDDDELGDDEDGADDDGDVDEEGDVDAEDDEEDNPSEVVDDFEKEVEDVTNT